MAISNETRPVDAASLLDRIIERHQLEFDTCHQARATWLKRLKENVIYSFSLGFSGITQDDLIESKEYLDEALAAKKELEQGSYEMAHKLIRHEAFFLDLLMEYENFTDEEDKLLDDLVTYCQDNNIPPEPTG